METGSVSSDERCPIALLPQNVIDLIAAGEVVQRPCSVVKELLENSMDAGATQISISISEGGLKAIQIQDNGCGIASSDLPLVCARHATSKLRTFDALRAIGTFGFRGEALAAVSNVARVTLTTRVQGAQCAYKANYQGGKMLADAKPVAGNVGTTILVEDLLHNVPTRRRALARPADEYNRIAHVVWRYALHKAHVAFTLRKSGSGCDVKTELNGDTVDVLRIKYGQKFTQTLLTLSDSEAALGYKLEKCIVTRQDQNTFKGYTFILFVNDRLVEHQVMKNCLRQIFEAHSDRRPVEGFVYIDLKVDPRNLDVNVHPAKEEVIFLHEHEIVDRIQTTIDRALREAGARQPDSTKQAQSLLEWRRDAAQNDATDTNARPLNVKQSPDITITSKLDNSSSGVKQNVSRLVRTDEKQSKLDNFVQPGRGPAFLSHFKHSPSVPDSRLSSWKHKTAASVSIHSGHKTDSATPGRPVTVAVAENLAPVADCNLKRKQPSDVMPVSTGDSDSSAQRQSVGQVAQQNQSNDDIRLIDLDESAPSDAFWWRDIQLASVDKLRKNVADKSDRCLTKKIRCSTFVGCTEELRFAVVQHELELLLVELRPVLAQLFYQSLIFRLGNLASIRLPEPLEIDALLAMRGQTVSDLNTTVLDEMGEMMDDYFSTRISSQNISALPQVLSNWDDLPIGALPELINDILEVLTSVQDEKECIERLCMRLSQFYASVLDCPNVDVHCLVANVFWPAAKRKLLVPAHFGHSAIIRTLVDVPKLYTVFERC